MKHVVWSVGLVALCNSVVVAGDGWRGFRGPTSNGVAAAGEYPTHWSATEQIAWKVELPGAGSSTPAVTPERIVVTAARNGQNVALSYSRTGQLQWETVVGHERPGKNKKASGANPSAVIDDERIYVYFKSGDLAALDFAGKVVWHVNLQEQFGADDLWWDLGTSPVRTARHLVIAVMQTENSYLAAFDPQTGKLAWKVDRNLGAPEEAAQSYSTPVVIEHNGQEQLVVLGADHVTCHAAADGRELWRVGGLNPNREKYFRSIAGPVVSDGIVIAPYARGDTVTGIRLGGSGDVTKSHVVWHLTDAGADVPTPAAVQGRFYVLRDKAKSIVCRDVGSGEVIWSQPLKTRRGFSASPILANGRLYCTDEDGVTFVVSAQTGAVEAENHLDHELTVATPVCVDGQVLLRTVQHLYCIGPAGSIATGK